MKAYTCFCTMRGIEMVLAVGKWCFNGMYLACESATIVSTSLWSIDVKVKEC